MGWDTGTASSPVGGASDFRSRIDKLTHASADAGEEIRMDDISGGDLYIGAAIDGTLTSDSVWDVVRIYRTAEGVTTRIRLRQNIVWDDRTVGW